jgi:quercetin dioxygenase-like cupin family protein
MAMLEHELAPPLPGSALTARERRLGAGEVSAVGDREQDCLLYVFGGSGTITLDSRVSDLERGAAALVLAGEHGQLEAGSSGLAALLTTVAPIADRHAPMGRRELTARLDDAGAERATGARSFQILYGPESGSTRATLFAGFIPPGRAPWHYHLYDEIVWVPEGPGRLHREDGTEELGPGSAFRLRPRQVHIVENLSADREMTVIGIFTPAGSPSAAYLTPDVAAEYRFSG